jgi:hypothetical protein
MDYDRHPEYHILVANLSGEMSGPAAIVSASHIFTRLWQEFGYYAALKPLGCIPKEEFHYVIERILFGASEEKVQALIAQLLESGLVHVDSEYYFSSKFFKLNQHLLIAIPALEKHRYWNRKKRFEKKLNENPFEIPENFQYVDGVKAPPALVNRAITTVRMVDSILGRPARLTQEWAEGLIQDSLRFVMRFKPREIDVIMMTMLSNRTNPRIPRTTELLFPEIDFVIALLEIDVANASRMEKVEDEDHAAPTED